MAAQSGLRLNRSEPVGDDRAAEGVVKSAKRVLEIFEYFAERQRPASVGDVVEALGYPQSSTSALLKSLVQLRYLDYDRETRRFQPTMRVAFLGGWVHDQLFSDNSLLRLLDDLYRATGHTILVGMQNDIYVQYVHLIQVQEKDWYIKPGSLRPLCRAAVGRVLLSRKPDVEVLGLVRRINAEERDPEKRVRPSELLEELDRVRRQGYAYTEGTVIPTSGVIAMELPTPPSQPPMAIGIGCEIARLRDEREKIVDLLHTALQPYYQTRGRAL